MILFQSLRKLSFRPFVSRCSPFIRNISQINNWLCEVRLNYMPLIERACIEQFLFLKWHGIDALLHSKSSSPFVSLWKTLSDAGHLLGSGQNTSYSTAGQVKNFNCTLKIRIKFYSVQQAFSHCFKSQIYISMMNKRPLLFNSASEEQNEALA